jgi:hypothetical protein
MVHLSPEPLRQLVVDGLGHVVVATVHQIRPWNIDASFEHLGGPIVGTQVTPNPGVSLRRDQLIPVNKAVNKKEQLEKRAGGGGEKRYTSHKIN